MLIGRSDVGSRSPVNQRQKTRVTDGSWVGTARRRYSRNAAKVAAVLDREGPAWG